MTNTNNTSLYDEFGSHIKAYIESMRSECKAAREVDAILTNHFLGILGKISKKQQKFLITVPPFRYRKQTRLRLGSVAK